MQRPDGTDRWTPTDSCTHPALHTMWAVPTTQVHKVNVAIIPYTDTCTLQLHYIEEGVERETRYR